MKINLLIALAIMTFLIAGCAGKGEVKVSDGGLSAKDCGVVDFGNYTQTSENSIKCFQAQMDICEPGKIIIKIAGKQADYSVKGKEGDNCAVESVTSDGQKLSCILPAGSKFENVGAKNKACTPA